MLSQIILAKVDPKLWPYGFNSYRLRVNKLELELERIHCAALTRNHGAK